MKLKKYFDRFNYKKNPFYKISKKIKPVTASIVLGLILMGLLIVSFIFLMMINYYEPQ